MVRADHEAECGGNGEQTDAQRLAFRRPLQPGEMQIPEEIREGRIGRTDELPVDRKGIKGVARQKQIRDGLEKAPGDQHPEPHRDNDEPTPDRRGLPPSEKSEDKQEMQKYANSLHYKVGDPVTVHKFNPFYYVFLSFLSGINSTILSISQSRASHIFPSTSIVTASSFPILVIA